MLRVLNHEDSAVVHPSRRRFAAPQEESSASMHPACDVLASLKTLGFSRGARLDYKG
jgi:hypothetical protein